MSRHYTTLHCMWKTVTTGYRYVEHFLSCFLTIVALKTQRNHILTQQNFVCLPTKSSHSWYRHMRAHIISETVEKGISTRKILNLLHKKRPGAFRNIVSYFPHTLFTNFTSLCNNETKPIGYRKLWRLQNRSIKKKRKRNSLKFVSCGSSNGFAWLFHFLWYDPLSFFIISRHQIKVLLLNLILNRCKHTSPR